MMQDEDLGGPSRRNAFVQAATRISQVYIELLKFLPIIINLFK